MMCINLSISLLERNIMVYEILSAETQVTTLAPNLPIEVFHTTAKDIPRNGMFFIHRDTPEEKAIAAAKALPFEAILSLHPNMPKAIAANVFASLSEYTFLWLHASTSLENNIAMVDILPDTVICRIDPKPQNIRRWQWPKYCQMMQHFTSKKEHL